MGVVVGVGWGGINEKGMRRQGTKELKTDVILMECNVCCCVEYLVACYRGGGDTAFWDDHVLECFFFLFSPNP